MSDYMASKYKMIVYIVKLKVKDEVDVVVKRSDS